MEFPTRKWTMVVDLDKCTGCNACVVACHAENNVPDRAATTRSSADAPCIGSASSATGTGSTRRQSAAFLPLLCQQCFRAPCEPVCPVYATLHSERENLNLQVYNRCVGTRYCQNNDPYKVQLLQLLSTRLR